MVPSFFRLPRELRDQIYEYALYDANGLHYRECSDGVIRLCTRRKHSSIHSAIATWLSRCSFNRLVGQRKGYGEKNQLKYVCRRLYEETRGLEVRYNLIVLEDTTTMTALEQYLVLFRRCNRLRAVAIKCSPRSFASTHCNGQFSTIAAHCRANADLMIRVHIPYWSQADPNFIPLGLYFWSTIRPDTCFSARLARETLVPSHSDMGVITTLMQVPSNFRLCPKEERFKQHVLERSCRKHPRVQLPTTQAALWEVMEIIEGWFENGL